MIIPPIVHRRGVYFDPWLGGNGEILVTVVNRLGRRIFEAAIINAEHAESVVEALWEFLDREDPEPRLQLIN